MSIAISGIYQIQSKIKPERIYVGSSVNIHKRWNRHLLDLKNNIHSSIKLQRHYNKYGKCDLIFSIKIGCDKDDLITTEQFFIDLINPYFNNCKVAGNTTGRIVSELTRKKLSIKSLGNKGRRGQPLSPELKEKLRQNRLGSNNPFFNKHHTEESNKKRREWALAHNIRPPIYHGGRSKKILVEQPCKN